MDPALALRAYADVAAQLGPPTLAYLAGMRQAWDASAVAERAARAIATMLAIEDRWDDRAGTLSFSGRRRIEIGAVFPGLAGEFAGFNRDVMGPVCECFAGNAHASILEVKSNPIKEDSTQLAHE